MSSNLLKQNLAFIRLKKASFSEQQELHFSAVQRNFCYSFSDADLGLKRRCVCVERGGFAVL